MNLRTRPFPFSVSTLLLAVAFLLISLHSGNALSFETSFDCAKAATNVEKMICGDARLAAYDRDMAADYTLLRQLKPEAVQDQRQWLQARDACGNVDCLGIQYAIRLSVFKTLLRAINAQATQPPAPVQYQRAPPAVPAAPYSGAATSRLHTETNQASPAAPVVAAPTETVSAWQKTKDFVRDKSGFLVLVVLAALAYFMRKSPRINQLVELYGGRILNSRFAKKARRLAREFKNRLERIEAEKPVVAFVAALAVAFLSKLATNDFNVLAHSLVLGSSEASVSYEFKAYLAITRDLVEYAVIFFALFSFACVPFYAGVLFGLVQDVFGGFSYPAALVPFGLEAALIVYVALFQYDTVVAWRRKWWRQKQALALVLGFAAYLIVVYGLAQFVAAQHGAVGETLVWLIASILFVIWFKKRRRPPETTLFDATREPEKYFQNDGVVLGWCHCNIPEQGQEEDEELKPYQKAPHVLRYQTDKHFLSIMPNRSGKGRSQIIPNLLQLSDWSCWVVDPKGENALVTAQWRQAQGHEIVIFNPYGLWAEEFKARGFDSFQTFNPMLNLDPTSDRFIGDVDTLADALIYNTGGDSHWSEGARGLVALLMMYLVTEPTETPTFRRLRELIAGGAESLEVAFGLMQESPFDLVKENVGRYANSTKETEGIIATAETQTGIFRNKTLCNALDGKAFDFEAMKNRKMTVYMILPAEYLVTQARFLRLILLSAMSQFTHSEQGKHRIMVLLDEFANLGPLQIVEQGAALISGYGVTLWPFVQNLSQLQKLYPNNWEVFIANAAAITVANVNDVTTAEYFSKRAGKTIKHLFSWSSSTTSGEKGSSTSSSSKSESIQDILPVEDMYNLWGGEGYVFFEGKAPPLIAVKSNYDDPRLPWHERAASNPMVKFWR